MYPRNTRFITESCALLLVALAWCGSARGELVPLPDSHHHQYRTYGLFFEQQSSLLFRDSSRAWGAVAGHIALLEAKGLRWSPQLILHASANASFRLDTKAGLLTETVDARVGLGIDLRLADEYRGEIIWTHQSGHISDDVPDRDLFGPNLGNEILSFRLIRDLDRKWRLGGSLRPVLGADPAMLAFGAEQFVEYFPNGEGASPRDFAPFLAAGLEEYGRSRLGLSFHAQLGFTAGSHFREDKHPSLRPVLGYYDGADLRLKYFQFKDSRERLVYLGVMFEN